jgi:hypothetical protein
VDVVGEMILCFVSKKVIFQYKSKKGFSMPDRIRYDVNSNVIDPTHHVGDVRYQAAVPTTSGVELQSRPVEQIQSAGGGNFRISSIGDRRFWGTIFGIAYKNICSFSSKACSVSAQNNLNLMQSDFSFSARKRVDFSKKALALSSENKLILSI